MTTTTRKIVQICTDSQPGSASWNAWQDVVALCDDGTLWTMPLTVQAGQPRLWTQQPAIPQPEPQPAATPAARADAAQSREQHTQAMLDAAIACIDEIRALMPQEWHGVELAWCVQQLAKRAVAKERAEIMALFETHRVLKLPALAAFLHEIGHEDDADVLRKLNARLTPTK